MSKYLDLSIQEIHRLLIEKTIRPIDLVEECLERISLHPEWNAFITLNERAKEEAKALEKIEIEEENLLFGIPIAIKDNITTQGLRTTCASKMLENFIPIYDATVVEKVRSAHMIIIGKTNMDEFAMGSTSQTSYFGSPKNPWNTEMVSGGSSGGNATAVSGRLVPFALGSDTGGSIRQPASYCGLVGMKPTYGRVSRNGLIAFASSLDQIGPMTRTVYENALLLNAIVGKDPKDLTSCDCKIEDFTREIGQPIQDMKVGVPTFFMSEIVEEEVKQKVEETIAILKAQGAVVEPVEINYLEFAVPLYQILAMGEASSNLARFDGIRYGYTHEDPENLEDLYRKTRAEGFGKEVKRRIMVGSYLLSGKNAVTYYNKALEIRDDIKKSFDRAFETYDLIIGPTATTTAYPLGVGLEDPSKTFLDDVLVIPVNMAGLPGLNVPIGFSKEKLPIGLHIIGNRFQEAKMYRLAAWIEQNLDLNLDPTTQGAD